MMIKMVMGDDDNGYDGIIMIKMVMMVKMMTMV